MRPLLGRNIEPSDAENGGRWVVVLNYRFWKSHFSGDPHIVGRTLEMDHAPYTIVGVKYYEKKIHPSSRVAAKKIAADWRELENPARMGG